MICFYEYWRENELEPQKALRQAQIWLRTTSKQEMLTFFEAHIAEKVEVRIPEEAAESLPAYIRFKDDNKDVCPFTHPYYWAGCIYPGV